MTMKEQAIKDKAKYFINTYGVLAEKVVDDILYSQPPRTDKLFYEMIDFYLDIKNEIKKTN